MHIRQIQLSCIEEIRKIGVFNQTTPHIDIFGSTLAVFIIVDKHELSLFSPIIGIMFCLFPACTLHALMLI